jgi:predicted DNA-binding transcriptional regulator AlpA
MQNRKGIVYPRIAEEIVDYAELQEVLGVSYLTAYRIMHGHAFPNHKRKKTLSDYLGIPVDELWVKNPNVDPQKPTPSTNNSEII